MSQGVDVPEKPKVRGRGRGMVRKTSHEEGSTQSNEPTGSYEEKKSDNLREGKVRRTKAGFEPYQVKKKLPIVQDEQISPAERPRSSKSSSSFDRKSTSTTNHKKLPSSERSTSSSDRKTSSSGDRRQSSSGDHKARNENQDDRVSNKKHVNRNVKGNTTSQDNRKYNQKRDILGSRAPNQDHKKLNNDEKIETTSKQIAGLKKNIQEIPNERNKKDNKLKQKVLGHSLLECPCMCALPEGCTDCSPNSKSVTVEPKVDEKKCNSSDSSNLKSADNTPTINVVKSELDAEQVVFDTKFLVASPVCSHKGRSILESESESEAGNIDDIDNFDTLSNLSPSKPMTHDEINALFKTSTNNTVPQVQIHENSLTDSAIRSRSETNYDSMGSDTRVSTSSEANNGRKTSMESKYLNGTDDTKKSTELSTGKSEHKQQHQPRQRNIYNSIVSILNENKNLDDNSSRQRTIEKKSKSSTENKDKQHSHRRTEKNERKNSRKQNRQDTREKFKHGNENYEESEGDNKHRGGMISLPDPDYKSTGNESESSHNVSPSTKHVNFIVEDQRKSFKSEKEERVKKHLKKIESYQTEMKKLFKECFDDIENITEVIKLSENIQQQYGELIAYYQEFAFRHDFESAMWKSAFHNIITKFRNFFDSKESEESKKIVQSIGSLYWKFLQNGIQYLDALTSQLQERCCFDLNEYFEDPIRMQRCNKQVKFALRSCHLLLIYIGDLERYISQLQQEDNYVQAQLCYKQAQMLAPKNGKSYNQLGVVAVLTKRKLDAVYYYTRSLQASNPILTAKERLTAIFHEIKKKVEVFKQSYQPEAFQTYNNSHMNGKTRNDERTEMRKFNKDHLRDEIWIFLRQNQVFKLMLTDSNEIVYLTPPPKAFQNTKTSKTSFHHKQDKVTLRKINSGFIIFFLSIHCKLYTNIGLEEFTATHQETLSSFATLLEHPKASSMKEENILKYMAINIFSIHNLLEKNDSSDVVPNTALDFALTFSVDMFTVLCKHCTKLLTEKGLPGVDQFLPSVRVCLLWMLDNAELVMKSSVSSMLDIWSEICSFFNLFNSLQHVQQQNENSVGEKNVYLNEDIFLAGFKPYRSQLKHSPADTQNEASICRQLRSENLKELILELDETGKLPFAYDESEKVYKAVQSTSQVFTSPVKKVKDLELDDSIADDDENDDDVIIEDIEEEDYGDVSNLKAGTIIQAIRLRTSTKEIMTLQGFSALHLIAWWREQMAQKAELTRLLEENEKKKSEALSVLESHKAEGRHISENSPSYLVADTNCFIDHLQSVEQLLDSKDFNVVVPLIVINELDGLKKGSFTPDQISAHNKNVKQAARVAIDVLEDRFSRHDPNLRSITSSGNELTTIVFRAEELSSDRGTNDDVILSCCLKYCKEYITRKEGESSVICRDVVLLTDDRNLRLKAHARFVPTVPITTFMKMAQFVS